MYPSGLNEGIFPSELRGNGYMERRKNDEKGKIGNRPKYEACSEAGVIPKELGETLKVS